jgi:hypothetical protein
MAMPLCKNDSAQRMHSLDGEQPCRCRDEVHLPFSQPQASLRVQEFQLRRRRKDRVSVQSLHNMDLPLALPLAP